MCGGSSCRRISDCNPHARVGATHEVDCPCKPRRISIHALHVGADGRSIASVSAPQNFNPRARVGARPIYLACFARLSRFQSTRPAWGRDVPWRVCVCTSRPFQSTRPVWGRDADGGAAERQGTYFNPRARVGRDVPYLCSYSTACRISIHAPAWGATAQ